MKKLIMLLMLAISSISVFAQDGPIELRNSFWGTRYYILGEKINAKQAESLLLEESSSSLYMKKAKTQLLAGGLIGLAGGVMIFVAILDEPFDSNSTLFWSGFAVSIAAWPFLGIGISNFNKALDAYNGKYLDYKRPTSRLMLGSTSSGIGLMLRF
jgi:hypothetical protein